MQIPFVNLQLEDAALREEIQSGIDEVIRKNAFAGGPFVAAFEKDFAAFCETEHCIGVGNGTDALWLALLGLGIGPGDEVITVPNTFIATAEAISFAGAIPVFVDMDEKTYTMDPAPLERAITPRTKAIIPVHLYGQTADMDPILETARRHRLYVIEDACQAHGALYKGKKAGSLGHAGCFSFYPTKNLGAFGEAGAVVTNDRLLKERIECLRDHGQKARYQHQVIGWNGRMDGIQGAVLKAKLKHLAAENARRQAHARLYRSLLESVPGLELPAEAAYGTHVYHLFVARITRARGDMMTHLAGKGIGSMIHYPTPVHLQEAYRNLELRPGSFPRVEAAAQEILSLPMFPGLTPNEITRVAAEVRAFLNAGQRETAYGRAA
jgi:dTDP-4-amino-4,6-dideoxygalactose transaminase